MILGCYNNHLIYNIFLTINNYPYISYSHLISSYFIIMDPYDKIIFLIYEVVKTRKKIVNNSLKIPKHNPNSSQILSPNIQLPLKNIQNHFKNFNFHHLSFSFQLQIYNFNLKFSNNHKIFVIHLLRNFFPTLIVVSNLRN